MSLPKIKFCNQWDQILAKEFEKEYYIELLKFLEKEYLECIVYPKIEDIFNCFLLTPFESVKVVILGQDPYHGFGQADGLSFSVQNNVNLPPSLKNIYKELQNDVGFLNTTCGSLTKWAKQGVLLLNTCMTVREGLAFSHKNRGWEKFTDAVISALDEKESPIVFILWGNVAKKKKKLLKNPKHLVLESGHPSPLSAKFFLGCKHFSRANEFLKMNGIEEVNWQIDIIDDKQ